MSTTPRFWDCECEEYYIHPSTTEFCEICGFERDECPDSQTAEIDDIENHRLSLFVWNGDDEEEICDICMNVEYLYLAKSPGALDVRYMVYANTTKNAPVNNHVNWVKIWMFLRVED